MDYIIGERKRAKPSRANGAIFPYFVYLNHRLRVTRVTALECSTGEMSSLRGPEGREDKNGESAARLTMDVESEDVMEDSLDEIDEEGMTQPVPKLVRVFYYDLW